MSEHNNRKKGVRRLKRWPVELKRRIVEETFVPGASVSIVARRHNANANQVFEWRNKYRQGTLVNKRAAKKAASSHDLIPVGVIGRGAAMPLLPDMRESSVLHQTSPRTTRRKETAPPKPSGVIEITLRDGTKLRVDAGIDEYALRRVLAAVRESA